VIVALCPVDNLFDTANNLAAIDEQLARAAAVGAALAVFPECALTGFKARKDLSHDHVADALGQVQSLAARHGIAAFVPSTELDPRRGDQTLLGGSLAVAPDGSLLHPFEPHRRKPILVELLARASNKLEPPLGGGQGELKVRPQGM
jgi:predicted amidohydrolase